jgi:outer membrane immunogenic protein
VQKNGDFPVKKLLLAASSAALSFCALAASPASAAPAYTWTGFYVGAVAGGGINTTTIDDYDCDLACTSLSLGAGGGTIGGTVGYNYQLAPNFVVGGEGDFSGAFFSVSDASRDWGETGSYHKSSTSWLATVRGRAGLAVDRALVYVTGGLAVVDQTVKGSEDPNYGCNVNYCFKVDGAKVGAVFGAGAEYAWSDHWSFKAEYLNVIVPHTSAPDLGTDCPTQDYCSYRVSSDMQVARLGINYKF